MSVTIINALPHKKLWNMWIIVSSQQYINTILKILLVIIKPVITMTLIMLSHFSSPHPPPQTPHNYNNNKAFQGRWDVNASVMM